MTHQRRPSGCAAVVWAFVGVCALIALAEVYPPVTAPFAILLLAVIVAAFVAQHKQRREAAVVARRPAVRRWHVVERHRGLAPCRHCGAPNKGTDFCPFCGSALVTSREIYGLSQG